MKASIRILATIALLLAASTTYSQIHMAGRTFDLHQIVLDQGQLHYPYIGQATFGETKVTGVCWSEERERLNGPGRVDLFGYRYLQSSIPAGASYVEHNIGQNTGFVVASRTKTVTLGKTTLVWGFPADSPLRTWNIPERNLIYAWSSGFLIEFYCMQRVGINPAKWIYGIEVVD